MPLADLLGQLPQLANMGAGVDSALARNQQMQQMAPPKPHGFGGGVGGGGLRDFLGRLGDALIVAHGGKPIYSERVKDHKRSSALQQFMGGIDPDMAAMLSAGLDPSDVVSLYKMKHPAEKEPPSFVQEYEYREKLDPDRRKSFDSYAQERKFNPYAAPIAMGPNDKFETVGGDAGEVTATDKDGNKVRFNHETGAWEPVGGPTASPSGGFR